MLRFILSVLLCLFIVQGFLGVVLVSVIILFQGVINFVDFFILIWRNAVTNVKIFEICIKISQRDKISDLYFDRDL